MRYKTFIGGIIVGGLFVSGIAQAAGMGPIKVTPEALTYIVDGKRIATSDRGMYDRSARCCMFQLVSFTQELRGLPIHFANDCAKRLNNAFYRLFHPSAGKPFQRRRKLIFIQNTE
jgi:hypothetical protein